MKRFLLEILAPAGSFETLSAALRAGADAVYVGGKRFSARNNAENFSLDELADAANLCHLYNAQLHLAVNTIISDEELPEFCSYIKYAAKAGVDAFIVQDPGAAYIIRKCIPNAIIHGSTQMSVHTKAGASLLKNMGCARVVLSRELNMDTIKSIAAENIETEIFAHGALCMSVSGQCYMSSIMGSRSANRGCCGQACRLPFSACGNKNFSALSLKDLSLLPVIDKVLNVGVDSLKIEGRMKRPEYVASAVFSLYQALHGEPPDMQMLRSVFSRSGFTNGYFSGDRKDMFGTRLKEDGSIAQSYFPKIHELYRYERKVRAVDFYCVLKSNLPVRIEARCGDFFASVTGDIPETALNRPTNIDTLKKQLSRLGDTVFYLRNISADIDDGLIVPAGKLNELRRRLIDDISNQIISRFLQNIKINDYTPELSISSSAPGSTDIPIRTFCRTPEQALAAAALSEFVIIPVQQVIDGQVNSIDKNKIIISPPRFIVHEDKLYCQLEKLRELGYKHLLCHTLDSVSLGKSLGFTLHGGFGLNAFNSASIKVLENLGLADVIVSFEAKASQIAGLSHNIPIGAISYGRLPLMLTRNCPIKNEVGCSDCSGFLIDRTNRKLPVVCSMDYVEILNSDLLYMADKKEFFSSLNFSVVMLHDEDADAAIRAVKGFKPSVNITRGLYFRGI